MAVTLGLMPGCRALLNDLNPHLVNFYRCVRDGLVITMELRQQRA
jgi:DNA adenine methylase